MLLLNYSANTFFWSWSIKEDQQKQSHYFSGQDTNKGISGHNLVAGNIDDCPSSFVFFGFIIVNEPLKCLVIIKMCPNTHRTQSNLNQSIIKQKLLWKFIEKRMPPHVQIVSAFIFPNKNLRWKLVSIVHGIGWRSGQSGQTLLWPRRHITLELQSILNCSWNVWALRSRQDGEEWTGGMIVTLMSDNYCCYELPSERRPANFPCLHSVHAAGLCWPLMVSPHGADQWWCLASCNDPPLICWPLETNDAGHRERSSESNVTW